MKKILFLLAIGLTILTGCTGVKTVASGLENEAFISIVGNPNNYEGGVDVTVDETTSFKAEVGKEHTNRPKGTVYAISTGKHVVSVSYRNTEIYKKQIFVSAQETKTIVLP
jgi:hypothetical protein